VLVAVGSKPCTEGLGIDERIEKDNLGFVQVNNRYEITSIRLQGATSQKISILTLSRFLTLWTGFNWLRIGTTGELRDHGNEPFGNFVNS
jgi:hypothetical protein